MLKLCCRCSREAELSVVWVISTVGTSPRRQKCSPAVLFCHRCMRDLLADDANFGTDDLRKSVNTAYTHMDRSLGDGPDPERDDKHGSKSLI
jgi:hypothetical protein